MTTRRILSPSGPLGLWLALVALTPSSCAPLPTEHRFPVPGHDTSLNISGELYRPEGDGPFPAVILLHGSGGVAPRFTQGRDWYAEKARWLGERGYVTFVVDSFSGRDLQWKGHGVTTVYSPDRAFDILAAVQYLKGLPFVQEGKIGVIGWSHGGGAVLGARNLQRRHADLRLPAMVAFYPPCRDVSWLAGTSPLLILIGEEDLLTPAKDCRLLVEGAQQPTLIEFVAYRDAHHAFDNDRLPPLGMYLGGGIGRGETLKYDRDAQQDAKERLRRFLEQHLK
jgi:dienelactone hydrolase